MTSQVRVQDRSSIALLERREWTLVDILGILRRRRAWIAWAVAIMLLLVTVYSLFATRRYMATGLIEVQKESSGTFGLGSNVTGDSPIATDALDYSMALETQVNILKSDTLALEVIQDLKLEPTADYFPQHSERAQLAKWVSFWRRPFEPLSVPIDRAPNRRYAALKIFGSHLKVASLAGTRLVEVSYSDSDAVRAAEVVNHLTQALMDYTFQARYHATDQASLWLGKQLVGLKKQTEELETSAAHMERDTGMYGADGDHNVVLARLEMLNEAQAAAESNRILKEAIYRVVQSGNPEWISGLAGNTGASAASANSLALLQTLRSQEAPIRAELAEDETRYGPAYPRIAELHAQLDGVEQSIAEETRRVGERARSDYEVALSSEGAARQAFNKQKAQAEASNDRAAAYLLAKQEADGSRNIYEGLLGKLKEAGVLEGLRSTNMIVVNPGRVPPTDHPRSPNLPLYYAAALAGGLTLGSSAALVRELQDHSVQSLEELEILLGSPLLGVVPQLKRYAKRKSRLGDRRRRQTPYLALQTSSTDYGVAPFVDAVCSLRTSILQQGSRAPQTLLVTSSVPHEGKSRVAVNLAGALTQLGKNVLLVDADLRRPSLALAMAEGAGAGLTGALTDDAPPQIFRHSQLPRLSLLCGEKTSAHPSELLASPAMEQLLSSWKAQFDFILLDSPPVLPVTDARILAQLCDATLLVVRHGDTDKRAVERSGRLLRQYLPQTAWLGFVLNGVACDSKEYFSYYGYKSGTRTRYDANA